MIRTRVALFTITLLGFMYGVLSLTNQAKTDTTVGMLIAAAGVIGWTVCNWIEER